MLVKMKSRKNQQEEDIKNKMDILELKNIIYK
jgi:hypothetical protein